MADESTKATMLLSDTSGHTLSVNHTTASMSIHSRPLSYSNPYRIQWLEASLFILCIYGNCSCIKFYNICIALFTLLLLCIYIYYTYYDDPTITTSLEIFVALDDLGFIIVRLLILYYFLKKFQAYPWRNKTLKYHQHHLHDTYI